MIYDNLIYMSAMRMAYNWCSGFRFMESEVELHDMIQEMHVIATTPELYHVLVELNTVQSLLQLLTHDNTDILTRGRLSILIGTALIKTDN